MGEGVSQKKGAPVYAGGRIKRECAGDRSIWEKKKDVKIRTMADDTSAGMGQGPESEGSLSYMRGVYRL